MKYNIKSLEEFINENSNFDYHINVIKDAEDYLALNGMESVGEIEVFVNNYLSDREIKPDDEKLITSLEFFKNRLGEKPNPKSTQLGKYLIKNKLAESVNENYSINEAKKATTIEELEKLVPKVFKIEEFLKVFQSYSDRFSSSINLDTVTKEFGDIDMSNVYLSQSQYAKHQRDRWEQGYGISFNPVKDTPASVSQGAKEFYTRMSDSYDHWLMDKSIEYFGEDKFIKRLANKITKQLGKETAALKTMVIARSHENDGYDRNLIMHNYFIDKMNQIWHDKEEVMGTKGRGTLGRAQDNILTNYLNGIKQKI